MIPVSHQGLCSVQLRRCGFLFRLTDCLIFCVMRGFVASGIYSQMVVLCRKWLTLLRDKTMATASLFSVLVYVSLSLLPFITIIIIVIPSSSINVYIIILSSSVCLRLNIFFENFKVKYLIDVKYYYI